MYETLTQLGADVDYYIPDRFKDGYGPNKDAYERLIANGTELIVTVDNGVSGHEAITLANEKGVDVLVTDHHELPKRYQMLMRWSILAILKENIRLVIFQERG